MGEKTDALMVKLAWSDRARQLAAVARLRAQGGRIAESILIKHGYLPAVPSVEGEPSADD